ncbi:MAG: hypothetical protein ACPGRZ_18485, partial [Alphaproteobacteria bacterium]
MFRTKRRRERPGLTAHSVALAAALVLTSGGAAFAAPLIVGSGQSVTIGSDLTVDGASFNNGSIALNAGVRLTNDGSFANDGAFSSLGTIDNNGTLDVRTGITVGNGGQVINNAGATINFDPVTGVQVIGFRYDLKAGSTVNSLRELRVLSDWAVAGDINSFGTLEITNTTTNTGNLTIKAGSVLRSTFSPGTITNLAGGTIDLQADVTLGGATSVGLNLA